MPQTPVSKWTVGDPVKDVPVDASAPPSAQWTVGEPVAPKGSWLDTALAVAHLVPGIHPEDLKTLATHLPDWLPVAGGVVGGIAGGVSGAAAGGIGAIPGAVGGAALGGASGESMRQLANRALGKAAPNTSLEAAKQIGAQAAIQGGSELVGAGLAPVVSRVGTTLLQSAIKPGIKATAKALGRGVAPENLPLVKTLIKEGVNVTPGGIAKLDRIISATNDDISQAVLNIPGTPIDVVKVAARADDVAARVGEDIAPEAGLKSVENVQRQFMQKPANAAGEISAASAQTQKKAGYRALKDTAYGTMQNAEIEARKAVLRGLKEDIAYEALKQGVDLTALNAREGAAITAKEAIATRLAQAGNRDPVALAWLAHNPVTGLLYLAEKSPGVKSMLGRGLYTEAAKFAGVPAFLMRTILSNIAQGESQEPEK